MENSGARWQQNEQLTRRCVLRRVLSAIFAYLIFKFSSERKIRYYRLQIYISWEMFLYGQILGSYGKLRPSAEDAL